MQLSTYLFAPNQYALARTKMVAMESEKSETRRATANLQKSICKWAFLGQINWVLTAFAVPIARRGRLELKSGRGLELASTPIFTSGLKSSPSTPVISRGTRGRSIQDHLANKLKKKVHLAKHGFRWTHEAISSAASSPICRRRG